MEYRTLRTPPTSADEGKLEGRLTPFNSETQIGSESWGFKEKMNRGAFTKTIKEGDVVLLDNHDTARPIARMSAGTLALRETSGGVDFEATPANTSYAQDVVKNVRAKNYGGCSIGFRVVKDKWTDDDGNPSDKYEGTHREVLEAQLFEGSVCTFPAYTDTSVGVRDELLAEREAYAMRAGNKPYGDVKYADPKNGKYPIDTRKHILAAWSYINVAKNAAKYPLNGVTLASVKSKIKAAAKAMGIKIGSETKAAESFWILREAIAEDLAGAYDDDFYELPDEEDSDDESDRSESEPEEASTRTEDDEQFALRARMAMAKHALAAADLAIS